MMTSPRDLLKLALLNLLAVAWVILLLLLLAHLLVKCRPYLTWPKHLDQHKDMEVRGFFLFSNASYKNNTNYLVLTSTL